MAAPCQAVATEAPGNKAKCMYNTMKMKQSTNERTNSGNGAMRLLGYDRQTIINLRDFNGFYPVRAETRTTLHDLGLFHRSDPRIYSIAKPRQSDSESYSTAKPLPSSRDHHHGGHRRRCERKQKRGCRGGIKAKINANPFRSPLPSVLLSNVRSRENKLDYLKLDLNTRRETRNCCVLILTETWLNSSVPDTAISLEGLTAFRADRNNVLTGKTRGGGVCIYINNNWCINTTPVSSHCCVDIEFLIVKCRPFYLPREFTSVTVVALYIPPSADCKQALSVLHQAISDVQSTHPESVFIVAGDFNQANMKTVLPAFHQHVDFATRGENTLDLVYTNIKKAYRAVPRPHLGSSDHLSVLLVPAYQPLLMREKPAVRTVRVWPEGTISALQDCFERTDWSMFKDAATDCNQQTDVGEYATIVTRANQKPWMTKEVRDRLRERNAAFKSGDGTALRSARANLNREIRAAKRTHSRKVQGFFQNASNTRQLWQGIQTVTGYKASPPPCRDDISFLNELNNFFGRFEALNTNPARKAAPHSDEQTLRLDTATVQRTLRKVNASKAAGPDNIPGRLIKECADQLSQVLTDIFNTSLTQAVVPPCFKSAIIIPVPKKPTTTCLNDFRPVALTSTIMKCFKRVVEDHVVSILPASFDPFQFAYQPNRSTEDAISTALHLSLEHLEKKNTLVRMLFLDFSSAFNTIIPQDLVHKLEQLGVETSMCNWLLDFLTNRTQSVRVGGNTSSVISQNIGSPQGCVLSPLLFTLLTHDCRPKYSSNHILKYADDTMVVGLIQDNDELVYREEVQHLVDWCETNNLALNLDKTKEIVVDFGRSRHSHAPLYINDRAVEMVSTTKYLGVHITDDLSWSLHTSSLAKKAQQRLHFLTTFYRGTIESLLTSCISVWSGSCSASDWKSLQRVVRTAEKITGTPLPAIKDIADVRCLSRAQRIIADSTHANYALFSLLPSGRRFRSIRCRTTRFRNKGNKVCHLRKSIHNGHNRCHTCRRGQALDKIDGNV
ncbi:uncharacterized protein LOC128747907 [Synchiropus splendidus]|uniref:uncharacterized protein LOC128747907 n=1 Tax=Synchiropus splendidus TaxID=270530 RepID=UPI00237D5C2E|nr:uncharacterized protein LOC128747907 [Synchiropus splendidus]XP_053702105.1 uncharacterized protein LOC128747907 [Synchiropus splendidus]